MPKIRDLGIKVIPETMKPPEIGGGGGCSDCTVQQFSICGGTQVCTDCTNISFSICGGTHCGFITHRGCGHPWTLCGGCSVRVSVICGASVACGPQSIPCGAFTNCGAISPVCGGSIIDPGTPVQQGGGMTREQVAALKDQLQKQITALDEHA